MNYSDANLQFGKLLDAALSYGRQGVPFGDERYLQLLHDAEVLLNALPDDVRQQIVDYRNVELKLFRLAAHPYASSTVA
jgi:hypothetical protein